MASVEHGTWMDYWRENMEENGFTVPLNFLGSKAMVESTITAILAAIKQFGTKVTVYELIKAGAMSEKWSMQGYMLASYTAGCMIGSAAVATGRYLNNGTRIADVFSYAFTNGWATPTVHNLVFKHPQAFKPSSNANRSGPQ